MNEANMNQPRLDNIVMMLTEFSRGNFAVRQEVREDDDTLNTVAAGLNMLGEELSFYQDQMVEKNQLIARIINSSDQVFYVVILDPEDSFKNTFTYLSHQVEKVIGNTVEDVRDNPYLWIQAIHPDDLERVKADTKTMFRNKKPVTRIYRIMNSRTGSYVWLEDYVVPILDENGWIKEYYASARDITQRREAEIEREKLIAALSRRHDELMQFSHIVSHNLRSPVASILGLAEFMHNDMPPEELEMMTAHIVEAARSMDVLLHDLNKILSARSSMQEKKELIHLDELINSVCFHLQNEIQETKTTMHLDIAPDANGVTSIKSYVQSAVYNLVSNAIKYRSDERAPVVNIKTERKDGNICISVSDNGSGMDLEKHRQRLFRLYSRLQIEKEGRGLGLYMTKTQIESLGGSVAVESEPGIGSTFTITLPADT